MVRGSVQVGLPEDDHPDIRVEIDFTGLGARNSEIRRSMNKLQEWDESIALESR